MMNYLLEENLKRGDSQFPVSLYTMTCLRGPILPCHWHDEFEILHVVSGSAEFRVGDGTYCVKEGDSLFVNSGELHSGNSSDPAGCSYCAVVFKISLLNSLLSDSCQHCIGGLSLKKTGLVHRLPQGDSSREANRLVAGMVELLSSKEAGFELYVKGSLFMILSIFERQQLIVPRKVETEAGSKRDERIKKVIDTISSNYRERFYLDEMAALVNMNKYNFCRFFKEYAGVTPIEYLNLQRVNAAYDLLQKTGCSVTDAALQCGFDNMSYFARTFKKYKNIAPSKIKKAAEALMLSSDTNCQDE